MLVCGAIRLSRRSAIPCDRSGPTSSDSEDYDEMVEKLALPPSTPPVAEVWDTNDVAEFYRRLPRLAALADRLSD